GSIRVTGTATNAACGGTFVAQRTWEVTDDCGNKSFCSQTVNVHSQLTVGCPPDLTVPNLAALPPRPGSLAEFLALGGRASGSCGAGLSYVSVDAPLVGGPCRGTVQRIHTVTDGCSDPVSCIQ